MSGSFGDNYLGSLQLTLLVHEGNLRTDAQLQACSNASRLASKSSNGRRVHDHVWPDLAQAARHRGSIADIESHDV